VLFKVGVKNTIDKLHTIKIINSFYILVIIITALMFTIIAHHH
jgi:hypothetical protein